MEQLPLHNSYSNVFFGMVYTFEHDPSVSFKILATKSSFSTPASTFTAESFFSHVLHVKQLNPGRSVRVACAALNTGDSSNKPGDCQQAFVQQIDADNKHNQQPNESFESIEELTFIDTVIYASFSSICDGRRWCTTEHAPPFYDILIDLVNMGAVWDVARWRRAGKDALKDI